MRAIRLAVVFCLLGACVGALSVAAASWASLLMAWAGLSFVLVGVAYLGCARLVFAKDEVKGQIPRLRKLLLLPYFALTWGVWHAVRALGRESAYGAVHPDVYIGRRLLSHEYPAGIRTILDLTWEFDALSPRSAVVYRSFPVLDAAALPPSDLRVAAQRFAGLERPIYVHCAQGHGRTAMVAAALLVALGVEGSPRAALARIRAVRPGAKPNGAQTRAVLASH
jgi:hypothetical protein